MKNNFSLPKDRGFALIATVLLMVLLAIITVGTLSLSTVTIRRGTQDASIARAQANARMALMMAIGELQRHTGTDTRVTASSNIIDESYPEVLGVWRSWEGTNHETSGRPVAPDYASKEQHEANGGRFISWLVSSAVTKETPSLNDPPSLIQTTRGRNTVPLLSDGSLKTDDNRQVHVVPTELEDGGRFAWWISGENQKARIGQPFKPRNNSLAGMSEMGQSHSIADPELFGVPSLIEDPEPHNYTNEATRPGRKAITRQTLSLIKTEITALPEKKFHDLSAHSIGLLTNTATGGWRKDLSMLSEQWSDLPSTELPLFRFLPEAGMTTSVNKPTAAEPKADGSIFYPWSSYLAPTTSDAANPAPSYYLEQHGAVSSWHSLVDYMTSYKMMDYDTSTNTGSVPLTWARTHKMTRWGPDSPEFSDEDLFNYLHTNQKAPIMARIQWVFKIRTRRKDPEDPKTKFYLDLLVTPVYTLWNPHNVAISINERFAISLRKSMPVAIAFARAGKEVLDYSSPPVEATMFRRYITGHAGDMDGNASGEYYDHHIPGTYQDSWEVSNSQSAGFPASMTLAPGEVQQFSLAANTATSNTGVMGVLKQGYDGANAFGFAKISAGEIGYIRSALLKTDEINIGMRFDNVTRLGSFNNNKIGPGIWLTFGRWAGPNLDNPTQAGENKYVGDAFANYSMLTNLEFSKAYWNQPVNLPTYSVLELEDNGSNPPWTPVFSIIWGPRSSIGTAPGNEANRPTKGMLQNNPFVSGVLTDTTQLSTNHPANLPFDFQYIGHQLNSDTLPEEGTKGYIISGNQIGNGLSRVIIGNVPMKPIASLMELQGWDMRAHNPLPPFQYNIIGNSDANPMISMNRVVADPNVDTATNRQHDDSYCANHLLFDDWFVSSLAPEPTNFGKIISRDIHTVYKDFFNGTNSLPNRAYVPYANDSNITDSQVTERMTTGDEWQKVASRIEVEGMFNINSTSVDAWRAILGHARNLQVAHHTKNGITADTEKHDHVVSRNPVPSDLKAGNATGMAGAFPNASEYTGFRTLTDEQLDLLAERVVEQIRARGPFLSLSEFINRRLDNNENLALAGAVQSALNSLSPDLHARLMHADYANETMPPNDPKLNGADYQFGRASEGFDTYGLPGWIRQADILRPIAPILSARDDTFTIRAYGDVKDASGKVIASAWCEAVVTRTRDFLEPSDPADSIDPPLSAMNQRHGRRYRISSFRWLNSSEV